MKVLAAKQILKKSVSQLLAVLPQSLRYSLYRRLVKIPQSLPKDLVFKIAETQQELESALALLHDSYVEVGLMKPDPSGMRVTAYHALPSSTTLIGKIGHEVVATVTIIRDSPMGLPSDVFVDLTHLRRGGDRIAEISALAIKQGYRGQLLLHLMKFLYESCVNFLGINHLIATLTTDSKANELYESILFFRPIEAKVETNYAFSNFRPVIAEHLNLDEAFGVFQKAYSKQSPEKNLFHFFSQDVLSCNVFPERQYFRIEYPVMNFRNFKHFFVDKTSALELMTLDQLQAARSVFKGMPQEKLINQVLSAHNVVPLNHFTPRLRYEICLKTMAKTEDSCLPIRILNVSREGIQISSQQKLGTAIDIVLNTEQGKIDQVFAQKIWDNGTGVSGYKVIRAGQAWHEMIDFFDQSFGQEQTQLQIVKMA